MSFNSVLRNAENTYTDFFGNVLCPLDQLTLVNRSNKKVINNQYKYVSQQEGMISLNQNQVVINHCDCVLCTNVN